MGKKCKNCFYSDVDYVWNDLIEDEERVEYCSRGHRLKFLLGCGCKHFKKYKEKPYIEEFTECDKCEYLSSCHSTINITLLNDNYTHRMRDWSGYCEKRCGSLKEKKLSDMINLADDKGLYIPSPSNNKQFRQALLKAIEIYGDILYIDFIEDNNKVYEVYKALKGVV